MTANVLFASFKSMYIFVLAISFSASALAAIEESDVTEQMTVMSNTELLNILTEEQMESVRNETISEYALLNNAEPIFIGGARYQIQFKSAPETPRGANSRLFTADVPVYGDVGQTLYFDIFGFASPSSFKPLISASCGTYFDSDIGPEYVMSKVMSTGGTCQSLHLSFVMIGYPFITNFQLSALISEQL